MKVSALEQAADTAPQPHRASRAVATVVLLLVLLSTLKRILRDADIGGSNWRQGDWLINSAAGPIRRGIFGDGALALADMLGCNPVTLILVLQTGLVIFVVASLWIVLRRTGWSPALVLAAVTPASLLFWFNDPLGALRKEPMIFAAMALILLAPRSGLVLIFAALVFSVAVVGHEGLVLFLPVFIVAFAMIRSSSTFETGAPFALSISGIICAVAAVCSAVFALLYTYVDDTTAICAAILERGAKDGVCGGAIRALSWTLALPVGPGSGHAWTVIVKYIGFCALTGITFSVLWPDARTRIGVAAGFVAAVLLFVPLAFVAGDWGRWLNYAAMSVLFLLLLKVILGGPLMRPAAPHRYIFWGVLILNGLWVLPHTLGFVGPEAVLPELVRDLHRALTR